MKWHRKAFRAVDIFLFILSPMLILLLIVCVLEFLDRSARHGEQVKLLEEHGRVTRAVIVREVPELGYYVEFISLDGDSMYGFLNPVYYSPEVTAGLYEGSTADIIYLPPPRSYETGVALAGHFHEMESYLGYGTDIVILFLFCWLVVAFHPEWLYLGFTRDFGKLLGRTWKNPSHSGSGESL